VAQGAIGLECRLDDSSTRAYLAALDDPPSHVAVRAERGLLERLDGSCRTPIGALAVLDGKGGLRLDGLVVRPDGTKMLTTFRQGGIGDAEALGQDAGEELKRRAGPDYFA
jgi:hydroxymethylbilane synthase